MASSPVARTPSPNWFSSWRRNHGSHRPQWVDKRVAEKQAKWLEKDLAEEHDRDRKHSDRIELPD
jgi:hypothetical protein